MNIKKAILNVSIISVGIIASSFSNCFIKLSHENKAIIIVKTRYSTSASTGLGGFLYIRNVETKTIYKGESNSAYSPYIVIKDVPIGNYIVEEVQIPTGVTPFDLLHINKGVTHYDTLQISSNKIFYLGSYLSFKTKPLLSHKYRVIRKENDVEKKIYKQVKKRAEDWINFEIDYSQRLFNSDTTVVEFK